MQLFTDSVIDKMNKTFSKIVSGISPGHFVNILWIQLEPDLHHFRRLRHIWDNLKIVTRNYLHCCQHEEKRSRDRTYGLVYIVHLIREKPERSHGGLFRVRRKSPYASGTNINFINWCELRITFFHCR